jgi:hypothetical protein
MLSANDALREYAQKPELLVVTGSRLYGSHRDDSDTDLRGFFTPPWEYMTRLFDRDEVQLARPAADTSAPEVAEEGDHKVYTTEAFVRYLLKSDPQMLELLFAPDSHVVKETPLGRQFREKRHLFVSKLFYWRQVGFSNSEWRKARGVKSVVPERTKSEDDIVMDIRNVYAPEKAVMDQIIQLLNSNRKYAEVPSLKGIGGKRLKEFEEHGYTTSSACHSIRLLKQCSELLRTGTMTFPRPESALLKQIKRGELPLSEVTAVYEDAKADCDKAYAESTLPESVDPEPIRKWLGQLTARALIADKRIGFVAVDQDAV